MRLNPYLAFNGQCEEAIRFYEQCLGGRIEMMASYGSSPMAEQTPADWRDKIMHARLAIGDEILMASDAPPGHHATPQGFHVSLAIDDPAEAERIFRALTEGGSVQMPLQQTFWAVRFGMATDRFGIPWMVNCEGAAPGSE